MATDDIERLHYYQRQHLGALDFEDEQTYHRDMRRRLNLGPHTWGIAAGLELQETKKTGTKAVDIYITPGMAIDGYGREIVLFMPLQLDVSLFQPYRTITRTWTVCLKYYENYSQSPRPGYEQCDVPNQYGRVQENFRIVLANPDPFRDDLSVAGDTVQAPRLVLPPGATLPFPFPEDQPILPQSPPTSTVAIPYDESLPHQEFPADDPATLQFARWLIPLGQVNWDGTLQSLVQDESVPPSPPIYQVGRHYIGAVASRLLAPARTLVVRDRNVSSLPFQSATELKSNRAPFQPPPQPDGVTMFIEGTLEVERSLQVDGVLYAEDDIQVLGGALDFRAIDGTSDGPGSTAPLFTISRRIPNASGGIDLLLQIGQGNAGNNRFVVGAAQDLLTIADNGNTHLAGTMDGLSISGILDFGSLPRQMITLWTSQGASKPSPQNGIGIQANGSSTPSSATTYFRSSNNFYWFKGGTHSDLPGDAGGGKWLMELDESGGLNVNGPLVVNGSLNFNGSLLVHGLLDVAGPLVVNGPSITFLSTTNNNFSVTLGQPGPGVHGSDSIYGSPNLWLDSDGAVIAKQGLRISPRNGAAFFHTGTTAPNSGDVVVLDKTANDGAVVPSTGIQDTGVVGVAMDTTNLPGFILAEQPYSALPEGTLVALIGIVPCHVDNTSGLSAIDVGDLLTTGGNPLFPGYASKADPSLGTIPVGAVFGKAMQPLGIGLLGTISVLLMPG